MPNPELEERRIAKIEVAIPILLEMMQEGYKINAETIQGVPPGSMFTGAHFNEKTQTVVFFFRHPSLPLVEHGCEIPGVPWRLKHA